MTVQGDKAGAGTHLPVPAFRFTLPARGRCVAAADTQDCADDQGSDAWRGGTWVRAKLGRALTRSHL